MKVYYVVGFQFLHFPMRWYYLGKLLITWRIFSCWSFLPSIRRWSQNIWRWRDFLALFKKFHVHYLPDLFNKVYIWRLTLGHESFFMSFSYDKPLANFICVTWTPPYIIKESYFNHFNTEDEMTSLLQRGRIYASLTFHQLFFLYRLLPLSGYSHNHPIYCVESQ